MATEIGEVLDRVRRIETRLMRLCEGLGVDPTKSKVRATVVSMEPPVLEIVALDVSYGDLLAFCRRSGIKGMCRVQHHGKKIGTVWADEVEHASV